MIGYINAFDTPTMTLSEKLQYFSPNNLYNGLDIFSRELLFTFANDYKIGLPASVIIITLIIKGIYL
jgi:hypothetical protein